MTMTSKYFQLIGIIYIAFGVVLFLAGIGASAFVILGGHYNFGNLHFLFESVLQVTVSLIAFGGGYILLKGYKLSRNFKIIIGLLLFIMVIDLCILHFKSDTVPVLEVAYNYLAYLLGLMLMISIGILQNRMLGKISIDACSN